MSVLDKISNDFAIKLCQTLLNKKSISYHMYDSNKELFQFYFSFTEKKKDSFFMFLKLMPFVYYEHSKQKLEKSDFETILFTAFPDTRMLSDDPNRNIGKPIYTGIRIPFNQSDNFLSVYKNAIIDLLKDISREKQPVDYYLFPLLTFKNIHYALPLEYSGDFTSFVEYYGEWWGDLHYYLYGENEFYTINHGEGYQRFNDVNYEERELTEIWEMYEENYGNVQSQHISINETYKSDTCVLCLDENTKPNILFCSCSHLCACEPCFTIYNKKDCPVCRVKSDIIQKI